MPKVTMLKAVVFASVFTVCLAKSVTYQDCGSVEAVINSLDLSPCESDPCQLSHGTNYTARVNFTAKSAFSAAKTEVFGIIGGVPVPFPLPGSDDACKDMTCPVTADTTEVYTASLFCDPSYPKIKLAAKWEVKDDDTKADIFCFVIPIEIVK